MLADGAVALGCGSGVVEASVGACPEGSTDGPAVGVGSCCPRAEGSAEGSAVSLGLADWLGVGALSFVGLFWLPPCWTWENVVPLPPDKACPLAAS